MIKKINDRLLSLDVFRGLTIALMILVNSPGNQNPYFFLSHSSWNGCTLADLVFPFFIFIVGVSSVFSLAYVAKVENRQALFFKICKRSLILFMLGLLINAFPYHFDLATIRVFGVLQRIAICYFFSAILFLTTGLRTQALMIIILLVAYWFLMSLSPYNLTVEGNFAAYVDRSLLSPAHLYGKFYDPEGFLSTFPALATVLMGNLTAAWLLSQFNPRLKSMGMLLTGMFAMIVGWIWAFWFPINKTLWTSSYVLWTGGLALVVFALCYWAVEQKHWRKWTKPFEFFGVNALAAYVLHILFLKIQLMIPISYPDGSSLNLKSFLTAYLFGWTSTQNAALLYALCYTLVCLFILSIFYRNRIINH